MSLVFIVPPEEPVSNVPWYVPPEEPVSNVPWYNLV